MVNEMEMVELVYGTLSWCGSSGCDEGDALTSLFKYQYYVQTYSTPQHIAYNRSLYLPPLPPSNTLLSHSFILMHYAYTNCLTDFSYKPHPHTVQMAGLGIQVACR